MTQPIKIHDHVGAELQRIWNNPKFSAFCQRPYMAPKSITPGSLLFIGINPSYTERDLHIQYYDAQASCHPYFRKFIDLANRVGLPWAHLDMLFFRETNQHHVHEIMKTEHGIAYIWQQLQVAQQLLNQAKPTIIVVCNALARTLLGKDAEAGRNVWLGRKFEWDEKLGTDRCDGIPVFFSSMLSGQRALDTGSYERLAWHIRYALTCSVR